MRLIKAMLLVQAVTAGQDAGIWLRFCGLVVVNPIKLPLAAQALRGASALG